MIEQQGNAIAFYAHFVASGVSATGLTVTLDVYENGTEIVTAAAAAEVGDGLYSYTLVSGSVDADGEYIAVFKTAGTADQQHLPAMWVVGRGGIENLDAGVSTRSSHSAADSADAVWDEALTGATHNVAASAGRRLREIGASAIRSGTAQAATDNSITLDAGASATDQIYDNNYIVITEGTGAGQTRTIVEYNGTTKVAIIDEVWVTNPDATSVFQILAAQQTGIVQHGEAQAGSASTITLSPDAAAVDDVYNGQLVTIRTSTGTGQTRLITDYNGTTKVASISPDWAVNPTSDSVYVILPTGRSIAEALGTQAQSDLTTAVLAAAVEGALDVQEVLRLLVAFIAGTTSGADTNTLLFKSQDGVTTRITMTVDADGDRSAVVVDGS